MSEEATELEVENQAENETPTNESTQTVEAPEGDDVKQEASDYAAELAEIRERAEKQKDIIDKKNRAIEALKKERKELREDDGEVSDELVDRLMGKIDERLNRFELESKRDTVEQTIQSVASNSDEADLIKYHLENTIKMTGNLREDVELAKIVANRKKILRENTELAEALTARQTINNSVSVSGQKKTTEKAAKLTAKEQKLMDFINKATKNRIN